MKHTNRKAIEYYELVNLVLKDIALNGSMTRFDAVCLLIKEYGTVDAEGLTLIKKLYCDGFIQK